MALEWLLQRMASWTDKPALVWQERSFTFGALAERVSAWNRNLEDRGIRAGQTVILDADYSPNAIAVLLALIERGNVVAPLSDGVESQRRKYQHIAEAGWSIRFDPSDGWELERFSTRPSHPLIRSLVESGDPGLILFSSGSTGQPKASLHNLTRFLEKFKTPRSSLRTMAIPPLDHVAGLDTLFYTLASGGALLCAADRAPATVCRAIQTYRAELLPASATFLNLLMISEAYREFDLSSLRLIAYGSDVMPESTLARLHDIVPQCKLLQKYGATEFGSPTTRSRRVDGSLWMKIESPGVETKIVDGALWVRARSAMMGYLNAPSPFDAEGWMNTQDAVEVDGDYFRILGRKTEIINVGGEKVYPAEVEAVLLQMENVGDVTVHGEPNRIMGKVVAARVNLNRPEDLTEFKKRMRAFCRNKLAAYKIPAKVEIANRAQFTARFKKSRPPET